MSKTNHVSHEQFFTICEELRNRREVLLRDRPTLKSVCECLAKKLEVPAISDWTVKSAMKMTGVIWSSPNQANGKLSHNLSNRVAALEHVLTQLCHKLGERQLCHSLGETTILVPTGTPSTGGHQ